MTINEDRARDDGATSIAVPLACLGDPHELVPVWREPVPVASEA